MTSGPSYGFAVVVLGDKVFTTGMSGSPFLNGLPTVGTFNAFVAKWDRLAHSLEDVRTYNEPNTDSPNAMAADRVRNLLYVTGEGRGLSLFGHCCAANAGIEPAWLLQIDTNLTLLWSRVWFPSSWAHGYGVGVDLVTGDVFVLINTDNSTWLGQPASPDAREDPVVMRLTPSGDVVWSVTSRTLLGEYAFALGVDSAHDGVWTLSQSPVASFLGSTNPLSPVKASCLVKFSLNGTRVLARFGLFNEVSTPAVGYNIVFDSMGFGMCFASCVVAAHAC